MADDLTKTLSAARKAAANLVYNVSAVLQASDELDRTIVVPRLDYPLRPGPARVICFPPPGGATRVSLEDLCKALGTARDLLQLLDRGLERSQEPRTDVTDVVASINRITGTQS